MEEELPFELGKYHKYKTIFKWKSRGLLETDETIVEIYEGYISASNCELCGNPFKSSRNRHMDHDHATGTFRNIVCSKCNTCKIDKKINSNTGERYIYKTKDKKYYKYKTYYYYYYAIQIERNNKKVLDKRTKTLEEAIEVRDKFIAEHPEYFT